MRRLMGLFAVLVAVLIAPSVAYAQVTAPPGSYSFQLQARGEADVYEALGAVGRCRILTAGTFNTDAVVYTDQNQTTRSTTLTVAGYAPTIALDSSGSCKWYAPTGTDSFDVIVYIDSGTYAGLRARVDGVTRQSLKQARFTRAYPYRVKSIPFTQNTNTQTSTVQLPAGAVVTAAVVEVTTAATGSVSFGAASPLSLTSFCNAVGTTTAGFAICSMALSVNVGSAAVALQYQTSNTAVSGFLSVFYVTQGGN